MTTLTANFYDSQPINGEHVIVIFTDHKSSHIEGHLLEYPYELFMTYADATKKRKVNSWHKIVPLNKPIVARVDDANYGSNIVQVSLCYIYEDKLDVDIETKRKILAEPFLKNKTLISIINKLSLTNKLDINELWKNIIYPIDEYRRDDYEIEDMPQLLDYCINEVDESDNIKDLFIESGYEDIYEDFVKLIKKTVYEKPYKLVSNIEIISNGGVYNTIKIIEKAINIIDFDYTFKYQTTHFSLESSSLDSSPSDHEKIIKFLEKEGQILTPKTFVRCTEIAKKV